MSDINLNWLTENFPENCVIFDIGCANLGDTVTFKTLLPNNTYYAFECSTVWKEQNLLTAERYNINYYHIAISDNNNGVNFYPSLKNKDEDWNWSGSMFEPKEYFKSTGLEWGKPYRVDSITLNEFCKTNNIVPDFIHVDVEGAEYSIFKDMDPSIRPKAIWAEIMCFHLFDTKTTYTTFNTMMLNQGYKQIYVDNHDALYVREDILLTEYPNQSILPEFPE
jgi:FkbM family methyltransferase